MAGMTKNIMEIMQMTKILKTGSPKITHFQLRK